MNWDCEIIEVYVADREFLSSFVVALRGVDQLVQTLLDNLVVSFLGAFAVLEICDSILDNVLLKCETCASDVLLLS